jgi:hypothetical protein
VGSFRRSRTLSSHLAIDRAPGRQLASTSALRLSSEIDCACHFDVLVRDAFGRLLRHVHATVRLAAWLGWSLRRVARLVAWPRGLG